MPIPVKLIATGVVVVGIAGSLWYYGHSKYEEGYEKAKTKYSVLYEAEKEAHAQNLTKWQGFLEAYNRDLAKKKAESAGAARRSETSLRERVARLMEEKKKNEAKVPSGSTLVAPDAFRVRINEAARRSEIATGSEPTTGVAGKAQGKTETFDAPSTTDVIERNMDQYNELAARYNELLNLYEGVRNGTNIGGSQIPSK